MTAGRRIASARGQAIMLLGLVGALACAGCGGPAASPAAGDEGEPALERMRAAKEEASFSNASGRFAESEALLREALDLCAQVFAPDDPDCADIRARLAVELVNIRRPNEALVQLQAALEAAEEASGALDTPRVKTLRALILGRQGDYQAAYDLALEAGYDRRDAILAFGERAASGSERDRQLYTYGIGDAAHGFLVAAGMAYRLGEYEKARAAGLVARNLILSLRDWPAVWLSLIDSLLATIDAALGEVALAEERATLALRSREIAVGRTAATAIAGLRLADIQDQAEKNAEAVATGAQSLDQLEEEARRSGFQGVDPEDVFGTLRAAFQQAEAEPDRAPQLYDDMFRAAQFVYAGAAAETLRKLAARRASDSPELEALAGALERAQAERDRLRLTLSRSLALASADPAAFGRLREEAAAAESAWRAAQAALNARFPDYAALASASALSPQEIGALLRGGEALMTFAIGPNEGFVFLVSGGVVTAARTAIGADELEAEIVALRRAFEILPGGGIRPFEMERAHALHERLFGGLGAALASVDHLVVAPVGPLLAFPFSALVERAPIGLGAEDYARAAWFGAERAISYIPSVKAFANLRRAGRRSRAARSFIGFGDPVFTGGGGLSALGDYCQTDGPTPPELIRGLTPLPGTRTEVESVARSIGGDADLFIGAGATEDAVRAANLADYRILYFATHGLLPGELRCQAEPGLALTAPGFAATRAEDGLLSASEVAQLRLDADLVVLSACNTAGGGEGSLGGEALSGLASSFFIAGAQSLIVSHWQVESAATTDLMSEAFSLFDTVGGAAEALRRAQIDLAGQPERGHPFFWAAFTVIGDGQPPAAQAAARPL